MKDIKTASKALGCNVEFFIGEAAVGKQTSLEPY